MIALEAKVDRKDVKAALSYLEKLGPDGKRAMFSAVSKTARKGRSVLAKAAAKELELPQKAIKPRIRYKINRSAGSAVVSVSRKPVPMSEFKTGSRKAVSPVHPARGSGLRMKIRKNASTELLDGTFAIAVRGRVGVFERVGIKPNDIEMKFGPTVVGVLAGEPGLLREQEEELADELLKQAERGINFVMLKRAGKV